MSRSEGLTRQRVGRRGVLVGGAALVAVMLATRAAGAAAFASGRLEEHRGYRSAFVAPRDVTVWLPTDYDPGVLTPVVYMHDGQNLFDNARANFGVEWGVDEHVTALVARKVVRSPLVVGIASTALRFREYAPAAILARLPASTRAMVEAGYGGASLSLEYLRFIVTELKPFIDRVYRPSPHPSDTFVMGSSMGGLISLQALTAYPEVFGGAACLSSHLPLLVPAMLERGDAAIAPARRDIEAALTGYLRSDLPPARNHRLYMDHGTIGLDRFYAPFQRVVDRAVIAHGYRSGQGFVSRVFAGADHNERSWNERLDAPLAFLLG